MFRIGAAALVLGACFAPEYSDATRCGGPAADQCPPGRTCVQGTCRLGPAPAPDARAGDGPVLDAAPPPDARPPDAPPALDAPPPDARPCSNAGDCLDPARPICAGTCVPCSTGD